MDYMTLGDEVRVCLAPPNQRIIKIISGRDQYPFVFPTEWIDTASPYWGECRAIAVNIEFGEERSIISSYDQQRIVVVRCHDGDVRARRNGVVVEVKEAWVSYPEWEWEPEASDDGVFPTSLIPINSPYYSTLLEGIRFPNERPNWVHRRARDGMRVNFQLHPNKRIMAERDGERVILVRGEDDDE